MLALSAITKAQSAPDRVGQLDEVFVQSWKEGKETVPEQKLQIEISSEKKEYQTEIVSNSGKKYQLSLRYRSAFKPAGMWKVELREILKKTKKKNVLGLNLLTQVEEVAGMDYFPYGFFIGYLYPGEPRQAVASNGEPLSEPTLLCDRMLCYPIKTVRKIKVESFCVVIKVEDYMINAEDKTKVDSMKILIEFKDTCDKGTK